MKDVTPPELAFLPQSPQPTAAGMTGIDPGAPVCRFYLYEDENVAGGWGVDWRLYPGQEVVATSLAQGFGHALLIFRAAGLIPRAARG